MFSNHVVIFLSPSPSRCCFRDAFSLHRSTSFSIVSLSTFDSQCDSVHRTILFLALDFASTDFVWQSFYDKATTTATTKTTTTTAASEASAAAATSLFYAVRNCDGIMGMCTNTQTRNIIAKAMNCAIWYIRATTRSKWCNCKLVECACVYKYMLSMNCCRKSCGAQKRGLLKATREKENGCISISHGFWELHKNSSNQMNQPECDESPWAIPNVFI